MSEVVYVHLSVRGRVYMYVVFIKGEFDMLETYLYMYIPQIHDNIGLE